MAGLAAGMRLKSTVCNTEIMVIVAPDGDIDLTCGGAPMSSEGGSGDVHADFAGGTTLGKRYANEAGDLEVLCVKAGAGSLALGGAALALKAAKKLPQTD